MREICERFEPTITYNGARLIVEYPSEDFCPCIDSEAMTKLISNLLTNAGKYTKDTVKLTCGIHPTDDTMFNISVYDNGCRSVRKSRQRFSVRSIRLRRTSLAQVSA